MLQMSSCCDTESLLRCFGKIMAAATMRMHTDKSRYDCHSSRINHCCTDNCQITVGYL